MNKRIGPIDKALNKARIKTIEEDLGVYLEYQDGGWIIRPKNNKPDDDTVTSPTIKETIDALIQYLQIDLAVREDGSKRIVTAGKGTMPDKFRDILARLEKLESGPMSMQSHLCGNILGGNREHDLYGRIDSLERAHGVARMSSQIGLDADKTLHDRIKKLESGCSCKANNKDDQKATEDFKVWVVFVDSNDGSGEIGCEKYFTDYEVAMSWFREYYSKEDCWGTAKMELLNITTTPPDKE